jgi:TctA family transporter
MLDNLFLGFSVAFSPENLLFCFIGALLGTLIGVLPGVGATATIALLLPFTFDLPATASIIMLAGIFYGAQYGGSTTAILVNIPGESGSVVTCLDGHAMARAGKAGTALAIAALGSFFAGCVGTLAIAIAGPALATLAFKFGPAEYFSLMVLGLIGATVLAHGSIIKTIGMVLMGLLVGLIGTDVETGYSRMTFGFDVLGDGMDFVPVAMGLFGLADIMIHLERSAAREALTTKLKGLLPSISELRQAMGAVVRGTGIGMLLGILPGGGALLASFVSYTVEKKVAKDPTRFGNGAIEGVAGPEAANNAGAQTAFIPMLTLGIPAGATMALMMAALILQGIQPGPDVMTSRPELFWGLVASMWLGNLMLLVINLPMVGIWVQLLRVPYNALYLGIVLFCTVGVYSLNRNPDEVILMALFGLAGYVFYKAGCELAPFLLGFILGPMMEENLRRALIVSRGSPDIFYERPISLFLLLASAALLFMVLSPQLRSKREVVFKE